MSGFVLTVLVAYAAPSPAARPHVRQYTTRDGLPQSQVTALQQDPQGFLWVGTLAGGVARYDGERFDVFDATSGLPGGSVYCLAVGDDGTLYAGTGGGVARFQDGAWKALPIPDDPRLRYVTSVLPLGERVFIGTAAGVLLWDGSGQPRNPFPEDDPLAYSEVTSLTRDHAGGLWTGTAIGVGHVAQAASAPLGDLRVLPVPGVPAGRVLALLARPGRPLWVSVGNVGLFEIRPEGPVRIGDEAAPGGGVFALRAEAGDPDAVWIGTDDRGAFRYQGGALERFGAPEGLPHKSVSTILEDREGVLWFGTDAGLTKRSPSAFLSLDESDGLPAGSPIFGMAESPAGTLWLSAWDAGLVRLDADGGSRTFTKADGLPGELVYDVAPHPAGGVWVATSRGLARAVGDRIETPALPAGLPRYLWTLAAQPDGGLLIGGGDGVYSLRNGQLRNLGGPVGPDVTAVLATRDGSVWAAGEGWGVVVFAPGRPPRRLSRADGLPSEQIGHLFEDSNGHVWISTDRGVLRLDPDGHRVLYDRRRGLPDSFVYWTGQAPDGALWFGTNSGATRLAPDGTMKTFTSHDGLGASECNDDGFFVDSRGRVLIATTGLSIYQGEPRPRRPVPPPVAITEFLVGGDSSPDHASVSPDPGPIRFRFVGLSFTDEDRIRFRYRLSGLADQWTEAPQGQHETVYGGLAAGDYVFQVEAITDDGRRSERPAERAFSIRPHWWETSSAHAAAAGFALFAVVAVVRVRERRLRAGQRRLEETVAARTEELRRANELLATLAVTDDLTGVANRRRVLEGLGESVALARRQGTPLALALADLDHFKDLNDAHGHGAGDRVLTAVAHRLEASLRAVDILGRYGGEEFLVVLPGSDRRGAQEVAERLRRAVETMTEADGLGWRPGVSIGLAILEPNVEDGAELIRRADEALYEAKSAGRNRVVVYDPGAKA